MTTEQNWLDLNRRGWDERAVPHAESPDYAFDRFVADPEFLSEVVRFDRPRLGDLTGRRGVHLQCHIGTDTLSLHRLGARMTGLDFSPAAIVQARRLAAAAGADVDFVEGTVDDAPALLPAATFDLVYTGVGALCWLPSIVAWAEVVATLLAPGGRLFLREGHPVLWASEGHAGDGSIELAYSYFERPEPTVFDEPGTYVATEHEFTQTRSAEWNHGLGEIVTALLDQGLRLTMLIEHDTVPWDAMPGLMEPVGGDERRLRERPWRLPLTYTLQAVKPS